MGQGNPSNATDVCVKFLLRRRRASRTLLGHLVDSLRVSKRHWERERDYYKDGIDELQANLQKSKKMNAALLTFLSDILEKGIYPECRWEKLKEILTASTT